MVAKNDGLIIHLAKSVGKISSELFGWFFSFEFWKKTLSYGMQAFVEHASMAAAQAVMTYFRQRGNEPLTKPRSSHASTAFENNQLRRPPPENVPTNLFGDPARRTDTNGSWPGMPR